jgi:hypothetical protein
MPKPLRSQLNQIRAWVRQGRTDAWIAHQLDVPASELREFRRRHDLAPGEDPGDIELRDEIEAEIEATLGPDEEEVGTRRRRRRRRGRRGRAPSSMQATFDHGDDEGFGLWLDPAVQDDAVYAENWAGHRPVEVTIEPDRIVIRRA